MKKFVHKLAEALETDEDELLLLTNRVPEGIRERPEAFRVVAGMNDKEMDQLLKQFGKNR
ncbi:hypothetical protein [Gimesia algae]|uniref:hypothetical protein n=1 Tax=Gimesia algae TaxID=2527971 RepID=UPI0018D8D962|nr:hypothetical protein [Gimesia algae]